MYSKRYGSHKMEFCRSWQNIARFCHYIFNKHQGKLLLYSTIYIWIYRSKHLPVVVAGCKRHQKSLRICGKALNCRQILWKLWTIDGRSARVEIAYVVVLQHYTTFASCQNHVLKIPVNIFIEYYNSQLS